MAGSSGPLEKAVQQAVRGIFQRVGVDVANLSQVRRSMVQLGLPDLLLMHRAFGAAFFETKRQGGEQSLDQEKFEARCHDSQVPYVVGGKYEAFQFLDSFGLWKLPAGMTWEQVATPTTVHRASERLARQAARKAMR